MSDAVEFEKASFKWQLNWKVCGFSLVFFPLMVSLGFWQLDRAEQKRTLQQMLQKQQALAPVSISHAGQLPESGEQSGQYRKATLQGEFGEEYIWLLENQTRQGRLGLHVIQPFILSDGKAVLVDRGWLPSSGGRTKPPVVRSTNMARTVAGQLVQPSLNRFLTGQVVEGQWPRWILQVDFELMAQQSGLNLANWLLQIDPASPAAFSANWQAVTMPSSKHIGYAIQWFVMAFVLAILTVYANSNLHSFIKSRLTR